MEGVASTPPRRDVSTVQGSVRSATMSNVTRRGPERTGLLASGGLAAVMVIAALGGAGLAASIAALSFWHYWLYWLAYRYGAVAPAVFRRDALLAKSVALLVLGYVYFAAPLHALSLAVVAAGFALNALAAARLGPERTYYGSELLDLPPLRVTAFPYSVLAHPMLVGNILAYGGTLLNPAFRETWWPLACAHIALNAALLAMETQVTPLRRAVRGAPYRPAHAAPLPAGALLALAIGGAIGGATGALVAALIGADLIWFSALAAAVALGACALQRAYTLPQTPADHAPPPPPEEERL
jgi:hypothetical protein